MTPEALHLLISEPDLCRQIAVAYRRSEGNKKPDNSYFKEKWDNFIKNLKT